MARLMEFHRQQPRLREGMQIFVKTLTGKTSSLRPGGCIPDLIPTRGTCLRLAQQVYTSHDKSTPRATSLRLARKVSASHDKSPPRSTSPAPTSVRGPAAQLGVATDAHEGVNLHVTQKQQLAAMQATCPARALMQV
jgi:hypothetical protein